MMPPGFGGMPMMISPQQQQQMGAKKEGTKDGKE